MPTKTSSWQPSERVTLAATVISALATAAAAIFAAVATSEAKTSAEATIEGNRLNLNAGRPYLDVERGSNSYQRGSDGSLGETVGFQAFNLGQRAATNLSVRIIVIGDLNGSKVRVWDNNDSFANDIGPGDSMNDSVTFNSQGTTFAGLVIVLGGEDVATGRIPNTTWFMEAGGPSGMQTATLHDAKEMQSWLT